MSTADERLVPGPVPLWEVPGWYDRFGVRAGVSGRGDDPGQPFDLGLWTDQPVREVFERWRRFRAALADCPNAVMAHQVHGDRIVWHRELTQGWTIIDGADGHASNAPGSLLLVTVADCVPIYLLAPRQRTIALLHAGWRGTACGILKAGVEMLTSHVSVRSHDIVMHCGIAISGEMYEVGNEVLIAVGKPPSVSGHSQVDLRSVLLAQGAALGIGERTTSGHCTASRRDRFFSHRGSGGSDGRMVAYLGLPE